MAGATSCFATTGDGASPKRDESAREWTKTTASSQLLGRELGGLRPGDGDLDLYVANDFGGNHLYRNELAERKNAAFVDVSEESGVRDVAAGMSTCWGDYDNDGHPDLYVGNMFSSAGNRIAFQDRFKADRDAETRALYQRHARGNSLFRNLGDGRFEDRSESSGTTMGRWAWSSLFTDLDNDGWEDLLVANGFITQADPGDL